MPLNNPIADKLGHQLRRCSSMMMADLVRTLKPVGLKPAEATALFVIAMNPGQSQSATGRMLDVRRANLVPHIAKLLEQGLIRREPGRGKVLAVTATPKGLKKVATISALIDRHEAGFRKRLSVAEHAELLRLLLKLRGDAPLE